MRQDQTLGVADELVIAVTEADEVDVEGPRPPAQLTGAPAGDLDPLRHGQQFGRGQRGGHDESEVEKIVLLDPAPGRGPVQRRPCLDGDVRVPVERFDGLVEAVARIAEVGPEIEIGLGGRCRAGFGGGAEALDTDADIVEGPLDRRRGFVDDDLDVVAQAQAVIGDAFGEGLDEVEGVVLDDAGDLLGELTVVDRLVEIVGGRSPADRGVQRDVDDEVLALALLELEDAVVAAHAQAAQLDAVRGPRSLRPGHACAPVLAGLGAWSATAETTRQAIAEVAGSWTRTAQAPACAEIAEIVAVAWSLAVCSASFGSSGLIRLEMNRFRLAATSRRWSRPANSSRAASICQLCSAFFENPSPGSTMMFAGSTPTAMASSMRVRSSVITSATTSS